MATSNDESSNEERTEPATQFRREEFRRQGNVAISKELISVLLLMSVGGSLFFFTSNIIKRFSILAQTHLNVSKVMEVNKENFIVLMGNVLSALLSMIGPIFGVAFIVGLLVCVAQVGFHVTWEPLSPNPERINPISGFKRLFSAKSSMEALKAIFKLGLCVWITWLFIRSQVGGIVSIADKDVGELGAFMMSTVGRGFFTLLAALLILAVLDYFFQKYQYEKQMRMTRRETKEEFKLREGDPLIKSKMRSIQRRLANKRMMDDVPKADVIVTNPTHFAIALRYDKETMDAPKVTAKGADHLAKKIKEIARFHQVPIVENKPLARTLYKQMEVGQYVPRELYKAVAEVLAYVFRLREGYSKAQQAAANNATL